jgi:hypothetical protein
MYPTIVPMAETSRPPRPTARDMVESVESIDRLDVQAWVCQEDCEEQHRKLFGCTRNGGAHGTQEIAASLSILERNFWILRLCLLAPRWRRNRTFGYQSFTYSRMEFSQDETLKSVWDPKVITTPGDGDHPGPKP